VPKFFQRAPLGCTRACGSAEGIFSILTRHLRFGSGLASAAVPGYYQPSLAGLVGAGLGSVQLLSDSI